VGGFRVADYEFNVRLSEFDTSNLIVGFLISELSFTIQVFCFIVESRQMSLTWVALVN